jgi:CSLREA domain-containing protein
MNSRSWFRKFFASKPVPIVNRPRKLVLESLEDRSVPATLTVNSVLDNVIAGDGLVTLREAVLAANANSTTDLGQTGTANDTIIFDPTVFGNRQTIALSAGQLNLTDTSGTTTIDGGSAGVTIRGRQSFFGRTSRVFQVDSGVNAEFANLTITRGNPGSGQFGGGLVNFGDLTLTNSTVSGNLASSGGGIYNTGTLTLLNTEVRDNQAAGILSLGESDPFNRLGGGIYNAGGRVVAINSAFTTNSGSDGGGIYNGGLFTLQNSTVGLNSAFVLGGGIYNAAASTLAITGSTIAGNTSDVLQFHTLSGGGIYNEGTTSLSNTILADSTNSLGASDQYAQSSGATLTGNRNLVEDGSDGLPGTIVADARLSPLEYHRGRTRNFALLSGSPAIDAGSPSGLATDQRGFVRDALPDIGSYEFILGSSLVVTTTADEDDGTADPLVGTGTSLREAIAFANAEVGTNLITFDPQVFNTRRTITLTGGQLSLADDTGSISIDGGPAGVTIDGDHLSRIFLVTAGAEANLANLTLSKGNAGTEEGGAVSNAGSLSLTSVTIDGNFGASGGGVYSTGELSIVSSTFTDNRTNGDLFGPDTEHYGGGLLNSGGRAVVLNSTFRNNFGRNGGGVATILGNTTILNSTIANNESANGGGIYNAGELRIENTTLVGNVAAGYGGGLSNDFPGNVSATHVTIARNVSDNLGLLSVDAGGGIHNFYHIDLVNSIVAENTARNGVVSGGTSTPQFVQPVVPPRPPEIPEGDYHPIIPVLTGHHNLVDDGSDGLSDTIVAGPALAPLANHGGPTETLRLLAGSPAINAGASLSSIPADQRGVTRDTRSDIGAFELLNPPVLIPSVQSVTVNEGSTATVSGTFADIDPGDTVTLTSSVGIITQDSGSAGSWTFRYTPDDGPTESQIVIVTATDSRGGVSTSTIHLTVLNVAPTADFASNDVTYGQTATVSFSNQYDDSSADTNAGFHYAYSTTGDFTGVTYASGSSTYTSHDYTGLNAGSYTFYARIIDKDDGFTEYSVDVTVNKATLTVTADNKSRVYGEPNPTLTASYSGFVNGENASVITGSPALATTANGTSSPGPYAITAAEGTLTAANYQFAFINGTLTVGKASTSTTVTVPGYATLYGVDGVTLTATVSVVAPGSGTRTGTVTFYDGATLLGSAVVTNGVATLALGSTALAVGPHAITAVYGGDANFFGSSGSANHTVLAPATVQGLVYEDFNNDGQVNFGEKAIGQVTVTLTGTNDLGQAISLTTQTDSQGIYAFANLRPSNGAGYTVRESQPTGFIDGLDTLGTINGVYVGTAANDVFSGIALAAGQRAENYNFGERPAATGSVTAGQTATIGFWQNKNGQKLLNALNGGSTSTQLGNWLAATFPNMYASLAGKTNAQVATFYKALFARTSQTSPGGPPKTDAQVMATAFAVYVTNRTLSGTTATAYGFLVTESGVGTRTFNVGSNGAAFGLANNSTATVMDLLLAVNARSRNGLLYDMDGNGQIAGSEITFRTMANNVFTGINEAGDI